MDKNQPSRGGAALEASWHGRAMPKTDATKERESRISSETIFRAIVDLNVAGRKCSRQAIAEMLGIRVETVSDHIHRLKMAERIRSPYNGIFEPTTKHPPDQPVGAFYIDDGRISLERGDDKLLLNPGEWRQIGKLSAGAALEAAQMRNDRDNLDRMDRLEQENRMLRAELRAMREALQAMRPRARHQRELPGMAEA